MIFVLYKEKLYQNLKSTTTHHSQTNSRVSLHGLFDLEGGLLVQISGGVIPSRSILVPWDEGFQSFQVILGDVFRINNFCKKQHSLVMIIAPSFCFFDGF